MVLESDVLASSRAQAPDEEMAALEDHLRSRLGYRVRALRIVLFREGLVLCGRAESFYVKQLAQHLVMEFTSVRILANEIRVE